MSTRSTGGAGRANTGAGTPALVPFAYAIKGDRPMKRWHFAVVPIVALGVCPLPAQAATADVNWSASDGLFTETRATQREALEDLDDPDIALAPNGKDAAAIWLEYKEADNVYLPQPSESDDSGAKWTDGKMTIPAFTDGAVAFPTLAFSTDGQTVNTAFTALTSLVNQPYFSQSTDAGLTWADIVPLDGMRLVFVGPAVQLARTTDGKRITAVWTGREGPGKSPRVFTRTTTDGGSSWQAGTRLSSDDGLFQASTPSITSSLDGMRMTVAWEEQFVLGGSENFKKTFTRVVSTSDGGANWSPPADLGTSGLDLGEAHVTGSDDGQRLTVIWDRFDGSTWRVEAARSNDAGATWSSAQTLDDSDARKPQVLGSADGRSVTAVWQHSDGSDTRIRAATSSDGGRTWDEPADVSASGLDASDPQVAGAGSGGRITAAWSATNGAVARIQSASSADGRTWTQPANISPASGQARAAKLSVSADGTHASAIWERTSGDKYVVETASGTSRFAPGAPAEFAASATGQQVVLAWRPPGDPGTSAITGYNASVAGMECTTASTTCSLPALAPGTYPAEVTATNNIGTGSAAKTTLVVPEPVGPGTKKPQTASPRVARKVKKRGRTVLLRSAVTTNAGQRAAAAVKVTPRAAARVKTKRSGRITITTKGRKAQIRLNLTAPATAEFDAFAFAKSYRVKRSRG